MTMNNTIIEILTEEISMDYFLRGLLPRILPNDYSLDENCFIRPHEGRSDLMKSIPRKVQAYQKYGYPVKVLIIHDQDSNDCITLKKSLENLCSKAPSIPAIVRIACHELENWYLGDIETLVNLYPEIRSKNIKKKRKFKNPDSVYGAYEIGQLSKNFSKTSAARSMGETINIDSNSSPSFKQFIVGISKLIRA